MLGEFAMKRQTCNDCSIYGKYNTSQVNCKVRESTGKYFKLRILHKGEKMVILAVVRAITLG